MNELINKLPVTQSILEKLPAAVFEYTLFPSGRRDFTYISPYCEVLFGISSGILMEGTLPLLSFVHPEEWPQFIKQFNGWIKNAESFTWEGRVIHSSGKIIWIHAISTADKTEDGRIVWTGIFSDITARKEAEQSTREIKQRFELAAKGSDLGIWDYNVQTKQAIINDRWAELMGYPIEKLEHMFSQYRKFIHPEDLLKYKAVVDSHLNGKGDYYEAVYRFQRMDGSWRWVMERGQVVERNEDQEVVRIAGTLQDFENRRTEEQITNEANGRYQELIESLPIGIVIHQEGKLVYTNAYLSKLMGAKSPDDLLGKSVLDLVHPDYKSVIIERITGLMKGIPAPTIQEKYIRLDGKEITVEASGILFPYQGKPAIQTVVRDVTTELEAKLAIQKSETLFTQLFHNSPYGKVMLDETGRVVLLNNGFENMFGYSAEELIGKELNGFIVPSDLKEEGSDLNSLITAKQIVRLKSIRKRKDNTKIAVIIYGVPIMVNNKTIGIFGSYVDITDQKKTEEELTIRNAELDNFVYKVSHDLRAPLSSILGLVNLADMEGNDDSLADYIKIIGQKVNQLDHFISDVLSHSKNLKLDVKIEKIDLKQLIEGNFRDLNYLKGATELRKDIVIEGSDFYSDPWRIGEILRNFISNSIKYRDLEKPDSFIQIDVSITARQALLIFKDNGIGISQSSQLKIFDMFYRASVQSDGSGLGLYIVKNAVDKLAGTLTVYSELGKGTTFELTLPNHTLAVNSQVTS